MNANVLILLIGSNPLPNYVTARYLLDGSREDTGIAPVPDVILLLSSKGTSPIAETIIRKLGLTAGQFVHRTLMEGQRDPYTIADSLRKAIDSISAKTPIASLHLNITGGTKPMAVFATLSGISLQKDCPFMVSDLDPDRHVLRVTTWCQEEVRESYVPARGTLLSMPTLGMQVNDILQLHESRFKIVDSGSRKFIKFHARPYSEQFYAESLGNDARYWFDKINGIRAASSSNSEKLLKKFEEILESTGGGKSLTAVFPSMAPYFTDEKHLSPDVNITWLLRLFQGGWLEDMLLRTIENLAQTGQVVLSDYRKNVEVEYERRPAEIDLIAMKGYQMYLVSCTSSAQIKTVKQKTFEALYRAEQLGGEHAQVVMVSCMSNEPHRADHFSKENNLSELRKDLAQYDARRKCHLMGRDELKGEVEGGGTLGRRLTEIIGGAAA